MNILLLAFALPVATILLAIVLQKILRNPLLVAATFFAVLLIVTYAAFDSSFLVFAILYTILAYVTAVLTRLICNLIERCDLRRCRCRMCDSNNENNNNGIVTTNENGTTTLISNNTNSGNDPVIVLTNANNVANARRVRRNNCGCNRM